MSDLSSLGYRLVNLFTDRDGLTVQDMIKLRNEFGLNTREFLALESAAKDGEFTAKEFKTLEKAFGKKRSDQAFDIFRSNPNGMLEAWHRKRVEGLGKSGLQTSSDYSLTVYLRNWKAPADFMVQGILFPKGTAIEFSPEGRLAYAYLEQGAKIAGRNYPGGVGLYFDSAHRVHKLTAYTSVKFSGISLGYLDTVSLDPNGKVTKVNRNTESFPLDA